MSNAEEIKENLFCEKFSRINDYQKNADLPVHYDPQECTDNVILESSPDQSETPNILRSSPPADYLDIEQLKTFASMVSACDDEFMKN